MNFYVIATMGVSQELRAENRQLQNRVDELQASLTSVGLGAPPQTVAPVGPILPVRPVAQYAAAPVSAPHAFAPYVAPSGPSVSSYAPVSLAPPPQAERAPLSGAPPPKTCSSIGHSPPLRPTTTPSLLIVVQPPLLVARSLEPVSILAPLGLLAIGHGVQVHSLPLVLLQ
jgi:hypothetical protein